jgi:hypothetical protein
LRQLGTKRHLGISFETIRDKKTFRDNLKDTLGRRQFGARRVQVIHVLKLTNTLKYIYIQVMYHSITSTKLWLFQYVFLGIVRSRKVNKSVFYSFSCLCLSTCISGDGDIFITSLCRTQLHVNNVFHINNGYILAVAARNKIVDHYIIDIDINVMLVSLYIM